MLQTSTCSIDIEGWVAIVDVDGVKNDDTIGSERRVPLDVYGSGVQGSQYKIAWCISRSCERMGVNWLMELA